MFDKTRAVVAPHAHLPPVLKEDGMLLVTAGAVPLTVCGGGVPGDPAWDAGCQRKNERWALWETLVAEELSARAHELKRKAVTLECKLIFFVF